MKKYVVIARSEETLDSPTGDYTSLRLTTPERESPPTVLQDFAGGEASIWYGYGNHGEEFALLQVDEVAPDKVALRPALSPGLWELKGNVDLGEWLTLGRNGHHRFKVLKDESVATRPGR